MTNALLDELDAALEEIELPDGFRDAYIQLECLAQGRGTETFLVGKKGGEKLYVAKCYDRSVYRDICESAILKSLSHERLPAFVDEYQDDQVVCVVREYMEGTPLNRYMAGRRLSPAQAVSICLKLCDILRYLHSQKPPVIHRDIKPHNVIVQQNGGVALIDFDIARTYKTHAGTDTQCIGTKIYAPPEQYGFSQTDCRADIYALGVLLCYMLTGDTDVGGNAIGNKRLAAVVRRCTSFTPQQRYPSASAVQKALLRSGAYGVRRSAQAAAACAVALLVLGAGFALGRYTSVFTSAETAQSIRFQEPLIERAVRAQLDKPDGEAITDEELRSVHSIYIFGNEVSAAFDDFKDGLSGSLAALPPGEITSLGDVELLPNLETLAVNYQSLRDIEPLKRMQVLRSVDLRHTNISDISPLSGLLKLESVVLFDTNVSDLAPLQACPRLQSLDIGLTLVGGIADIPDLPVLTRLSLRGLPLKSLAGIERFAQLEWLCLADTDAKDLTPLLALDKLEEIIVSESMRASVEALGETYFTVQYE